MVGTVDIQKLHVALETEVERSASMYHARVEDRRDDVTLPGVMSMAQAHRTYVSGLNYALQQAAEQAGVEIPKLEPQFSTEDYEDSIPFRR